MLDVKKAIRHLMIDRDLKAKNMADLLDMNVRTYSNWLYKPDDPRLGTIEAMLGVLDCHLAIVDDETGEILF